MGKSCLSVADAWNGDVDNVRKRIANLLRRIPRSGGKSFTARRPSGRRPRAGTIRRTRAGATRMLGMTFRGARLCRERRQRLAQIRRVQHRAPPLRRGALFRSPPPAPPPPPRPCVGFGGVALARFWQRARLWQKGHPVVVFFFFLPVFG